MNELFEESNTMNPTFIFVDGSYYNFYRYYGLTNWWKNAYPEEPLEDPYQNEQFVEKFKKTHVENLKQIPKKLKLDKKINPILIVGKDCKKIYGAMNYFHNTRLLEPMMASKEDHSLKWLMRKSYLKKEEQKQF